MTQKPYSLGRPSTYINEKQFIMPCSCSGCEKVVMYLPP